jgi:hypothetical protein
MSDSDALSKLRGIEGKLADLGRLGKELATVEDPDQLAALQARFKELARALDEQVKGIQTAMSAAGLLKKSSVKIDLDAEAAAEVKARTGRDVTTVELDESPPRALTRAELVELAVTRLGEKGSD